MPRSAAALPAGSSGHFDLVSHWRLQAPADRVWAALSDPSGWPGWWPYVQRVRTLKTGGPDGVGTVRRIDWSTRLPYGIVIDVEAIESVPLHRLRGRSRGHLDGEGVWLLREEDGHTDVTYVWRVHLTGRWMRWLAPVLAPVFRWNHVGVMGAGEAGLRRHLARQAAANDASRAPASDRRGPA
jgi:uncharacterized protein YndB with AHSA1/START domain